MLQRDIDILTVESILEDDVFTEIIHTLDPVAKEHLIQRLISKATDLGVKSEFNRLHKAHSIKGNMLYKYNSEQCYTRFEHPLGEFYCGNQWICDKKGIAIQTDRGLRIVCHHPILIISRQTSIETGIEKVTISFIAEKGNKPKWTEITLDRTVIANSRKIVELSRYGVMVTSENANMLVTYLNDMEAMNSDKLKKSSSTSKYGWVGNTTEFMPFINESEIKYDGEESLHGLASSISCHGDEKEQLNTFIELRKSPRYEMRMVVAASFASVLLKPLGILPFFLHLYGETGKGKTLALMCAASIWGNPQVGEYLSDPKSTLNAFEAKYNLLNNLPLICDDTAQIKRKNIKDRQSDFQEFIYMGCSGKGSDRSNISHGLNSPRTWNCCTITNGERPITSELSQGGEFMRVIEVPIAYGDIFGDAIESMNLANSLRANYGYIGKKFLEVVRKIGFKKLKTHYEHVLDEVLKSEHAEKREAKQLHNITVMLVADQIATINIFKDERFLDSKQAIMFTSLSEKINENIRAYDFLIDSINMYIKNFNGTSYENYGFLKDGWAYIIPTAFNELCKKGGFHRRVFIPWAIYNGLAIADKDRTDKVITREGVRGRYIIIKFDEYAEPASWVIDAEEMKQEEIIL
jgi:uncharacterized protein (DUF927 family)